MWSALAAVWAAWPTEMPEPVREYRGAWVATVDNIDWPSRPGLPAGAQQAELRAIVAKAKELGLNMLVFQVRTSADALYESELEPSSWFLTGEQGKPIGWDPLEFVVEECHKSGLELHAWINPFRAGHPAQDGPHSPQHVSRTAKNVRQYGKYLWMDPACPDLRAQTVAVVRDLVARYDIDGLHIDDYFYPYPDGSAFPDADLYRQYQADGGPLGLAAWRRQNVDSMVQEIGSAVRAKKPWVRFGISPFGVYRPGVPEGVKAGVDQFAELAADARRWLNEGWCDYFVPQLYWKRSSTGQPFGRLLDWWLAENHPSMPLLAGLFTSQCGPEFGKWPASEITAQVRLARERGAAGTVHFSMRALMGDWNGVGTALRPLYAQPALPPMNPRAKSAKPDAPVRWLLVERDGGWQLRPPGEETVVARPVDVYGRLGQARKFSPDASAAGQ
jgi:uncharacterized lipoprotein YddW (UPF0748 family)